MSKGSFQNYQHYLPATYIRRFQITSEDSKAGKDTVYGFVKVEATSKQIKERITYLNATKICGQTRRHTVYIDGERDNVIEDCFKLLEDCYPDFVKSMMEFYIMKGSFKCFSGKHYFLKNLPKLINLTNANFTPVKILSAVHEIDFDILKNMAVFMGRFLCYRNRGMDEYFELESMPKLKDISHVIKNMFNTNIYIIPSSASIISQHEWKTMLLMLKEGGSFLVNAGREQKKEMFNVLRKMHRYMILPFSSIGNDASCRVYLYSAPIGKAIVSGDFPFIFYNYGVSLDSGCVFTISPSMALVFSSNKIKIRNLNTFSDSISKGNVSQAKQYIFSNDKERLSFFTKNITQALTESYGKKK